MYHFSYFWMFHAFLFNIWTAEKWSFLLHFSNAVNPSSLRSDRHLVAEEFVLFQTYSVQVDWSWYGVPYTPTLHSQFLLLCSEFGESVLKSSRSLNLLRSLWNQCSLPSKGMFVYHCECKHHISGTPCFKACSLWGHLVYHNKQDLFQSTMPDNVEINFSHLLFP